MRKSASLTALGLGLVVFASAALARAQAGGAGPAAVGTPATGTPAAGNPGAPATPAAQGQAAQTPGVAGWNGEHFYIGSADGQFQLSPVGYLNENYSVYTGDGAPPDGFALKRARFGFLGRFGKQVEYVMLADVTSSGVAIRDAYVQFKPYPELQLRFGQFKEPFSQEVGTVDTNLEFFDRSLASALYPSATGSYRSPGAMLLGDVADKTLEYWVGAFNGRGVLNPSTSDWPEVEGRLRISPLRWTKLDALKHLSIGASVGYGRSVALSKDQSFSGLINDGAYTFFPSFLINGPYQRYGAEMLWLWGPFGLRGEYVELHQSRDYVGSGLLEGGGFESFPAVVGKGAYGQAALFLTGEEEQEYAPPKVLRPVFGAPTPGVPAAGSGLGAWQLVARLSWLYGDAPGASFPTFTPTSVPGYRAYTEQITAGVNWYLNYWTLYRVGVDLDFLNQPSVQGILPQTYYVVVQQIQVRF